MDMPVCNPQDLPAARDLKRLLTMSNTTFRDLLVAPYPPRRVYGRIVRFPPRPVHTAPPAETLADTLAGLSSRGEGGQQGGTGEEGTAGGEAAGRGAGAGEGRGAGGGAEGEGGAAAAVGPDHAGRAAEGGKGEGNGSSSSSSSTGGDASRAVVGEGGAQGDGTGSISSTGGQPGAQGQQREKEPALQQ